MILIYAFSNQWGTNISRRVLSELQSRLSPSLLREGIGVGFYPIYFHPKIFFNKYISRNNYTLIIGLGDFFGDIDKIRLETIAHNVYGANSIYPFSPINFELSLPPLDNLDTKIFTVSEHMGKYNCNWIAYSTELYIRQHSPDTHQLFFHLPKKFNASLAATQIIELLQNNHLI
jgi:pyrrolidone-carboxylate peptidase